MIRLVQMVVLIAVMFFAAQARAADSTGQTALSKRQMIVQMVDCMKKRMAVDKSRSYNDALRACRDEMNKEGGDFKSDALVASEPQPKR